MAVIGLYTQRTIKEVADLLKSVNAELDIGEYDYEAWGFQTTSSKDEIKSACEKALGNISVIVYWNNEVIYENDFCETCGNADGNHGYPCVTTVHNCFCYNHDDEF